MPNVRRYPRFVLFSTLSLIGLVVLILNTTPITTSQTCSQVTLYGISNGSGIPANNQIYRIDPTSGNISNAVQVTLPGFTVFNSIAMAARPTDGALFAVVQTTASASLTPGNRRLVTLNPTTGVATDIGPLTVAISSIAFQANGPLWAVSGDRGSPPETLFTVNTSNAALTQQFALGNGNDGETIVFHGNGLMYHSSGNGTALFESVNVNTQGVTPIGVGNSEMFAMGYNPANGLLYGSDINGTGGTLFTINIATGARTQIGPITAPDNNRGLAFVGCPTVKQNTSTAILADVPDPSQVGQNYTVAIRVTPSGQGPAPTGTVTITDGVGSFCVVTLPQNACNIISMAPGQLTLTASYSGDAFYKSSTGTTSHTVTGQAPTPTPPPPTPVPPANCQVSPGCEGDLNRIVTRPDGTMEEGAVAAGDGRLDGDDLTWYDRFANGINCPTTGADPLNEFQRMDSAPLATKGDGALGLDRAQLERFIAALDPRTATGGPLTPTVVFCTGASIADLVPVRAAPSDPAAVRMLRIGSAAAKAGTEVEVPIDADLAGGEITAQFTVHIDPAMLAMSDIAGTNVNPDVILGDGLPEGTRVTVNTSRIADGDIGIVLNFNGAGDYPAMTAEAGTRTLVVLRFVVLGDPEVRSTSPVTFNDNVFLTKLSDGLGHSVAIDGGLIGGGVNIGDVKTRRE